MIKRTKQRTTRKPTRAASHRPYATSRLQGEGRRTNRRLFFLTGLIGPILRAPFLRARLRYGLTTPACVLLLSALIACLAPAPPALAQTAAETGAASVATLLEGVSFASTPNEVVVSGNLVAVRRGNNLDLFDMTSPSGVNAPTATVSGLSASISALTAAGAIFYLAAGTSILAVDAGDAANPTLTTVVQNLATNVTQLAFSDNFLIAAVGNVATFYDATNRTSLTKVFEASRASSISELDAAPGRLYALAGNTLSVFGLTAANTGSADGGSNGAPSIEVGSLSGTVTSSATSEPIEGAIVSIAEAGVSTLTDAAGGYTFDGLNAGSVSVSVAALDFDVAPASEVTINADTAAAHDVSLVPLLRTGGLTGTVSSTSGEPLDGATVRLATVRLEGLAPSAVTSSDGTYVIQGVPAGTVDLTFSAAGFRDGALSDVEVVAGGTATADAALEPAPATLRGKVTNARNGEVVGGAQVSVAGGGATATADDLGRYELVDLAPGAISLVVEAEGFTAAQQAVDLAGGATLEVNVELQPASAGPLRIRLGGFVDSPASFSSAEGGAVTMRAEVDGGSGEIVVEALFRPGDINDSSGEVRLGLFTPLDVGSYELEIRDLPPQTLPAGELAGIVFVARDDAGATATWPALNVPEMRPDAEQQ